MTTTRREAIEAHLNKVIRQSNWNGPLQCDGFARGFTAALELLYPCVSALEHCSEFHFEQSQTIPSLADEVLTRLDEKLKGKQDE